MDYVEWCGRVLDRVVDYQTRDKSLRWKGFTEDQIIEMVFDSELADLPSNDRPSAEVALNQAIRELYRLHCMRDGGPAESPLSRFWLTDKGQDGSAGLESGWYFMVDRDLESEKVDLLRVVNRMSEKCAPRFATVEPVRFEPVLSELGWEPEMARFLAREMSQSGRGMLEFGQLAGGQLVFYARYRGLVCTSRENPVNPFTSVVEMLSATKVRPATDLDFGFVSEGATRAVLLKDASEANACFQIDAWKASAILSAGVIEGCLLDAIQRPEFQDSEAFRKWLSGNSRYRESATGEPKWKHMGLGVLTDVSKATGLIDETVSKILSAAKDFRDTVHVSAEVREGIRAGKSDAELLLNITRHVHGRLSEKLDSHQGDMS